MEAARIASFLSSQRHLLRSFPFLPTTSCLESPLFALLLMPTSFVHLALCSPNNNVFYESWNLSDLLLHHRRRRAAGDRDEEREEQEVEEEEEEKEGEMLRIGKVVCLFWDGSGRIELG